MSLDDFKTAYEQSELSKHSESGTQIASKYMIKLLEQIEINTRK